MKKILFTIIILISISAISQNKKTILGTWIKTKIENYNGGTNPFIEKRNKNFIKYSFEKSGKMYLSSVYNEKGNILHYRVKNDILDSGINQFKIEKLDNKHLILIELYNNRITVNSAKIYLIREQLYLNELKLDTTNTFSTLGNNIYYENQKLYPKFKHKTKTDIKDFIQPFVEGKSDDTEQFSYATFVVNTDGKVSDFKIHHHINKSYDKNLKKAVLKTNGMWISPLKNGRKVNVIKEISFHYIIAPKIKMVNGRLKIKPKKNDITEEYKSLFIKATKEQIRGSFESALIFYSYCNGLNKNNIQVEIQRNNIYKKLNDSIHFETSKANIIKSEYKYVLKL